MYENLFPSFIVSIFAAKSDIKERVGSKSIMRKNNHQEKLKMLASIPHTLPDLEDINELSFYFSIDGNLSREDMDDS